MDLLSCLGNCLLFQIQDIPDLCISWGITSHGIPSSHLWTNRAKGNTEQQSETAESFRRIKSSRTWDKIQKLVAINSGIIVACFILCSFPWIIHNVLKLLKGKNIENQTTHNATYDHTLIGNSLLDPVIYFLVSYYRKRKGV